MLTVACVLKSGGIYDATWVARMRDGVKRHLPIEHKFVCLSDVDVPCERIPLRFGWPGWWSKIEALRLAGPVLTLDLDTAIVGDLSDIAREAATRRLIALADFYRMNDGVGSGVVAWNGEDWPTRLFLMFCRDAQHWMDVCGARGDQNFIERSCDLSMISRWQSLLPGQIVSYKVHCRNGIPPNARVVCLHGRPKFGDMPANDPVRLAWEMAA